MYVHDFENIKFIRDEGKWKNIKQVNKKENLTKN